MGCRCRRTASTWIVLSAGVGIPADRLEVIFEKFQQVEPTSVIVEPGMGLGLGLAISKRVVEAMGGSLTVESGPGSGTLNAVLVGNGESVTLASARLEARAERVMPTGMFERIDNVEASVHIQDGAVVEGLLPALPGALPQERLPRLLPLRARLSWRV